MAKKAIAIELVDGSEQEVVASFPTKWDISEKPLENVLFCGFQTVTKEKSGEAKDFQVCVFKSIITEERYSTSASAMLADELAKNTDMCATLYIKIEVTGEIPAARKGLNPTKVYTFKKGTLKEPVDPRWLQY